ncbi:UDP-2,4-diacetamido-2,4,6-trideoxy-beta-L-altropyranose hydrolase [Crenobacter luteus]|uniref:UDP-2,4-diacetamido-2,4, 6-trideoxy-beta-L-altropyranose hydrolase n=1 Tax=Crenobacter luteus TaxID=1452487 RepID=A0A161S9S6_9NEIS|nr:UDP-2,4-diacetamido-2,4,6-trideoxy-beta-L-altropyranose hydrolase [Crenobacter luteus]KZE32433.1 UDP-2,4-diacetamido-2,4,6-trideoxy-beta-L-altropyranose hydrolase [Crenobacter luteus]
MMQSGKRFVFRVDASLQIGTGHVMRCLTLADALSRQGASCLFVCRAHEGHLAALIRARGYRCMLLASSGQAAKLAEEGSGLAHAAWLGCSLQTDAAQTAAILADIRPDWLIVDHYALDARWERSQRQYVGRILSIDDLADRRHDCDVLLDQNLGRQAADYAGLLPPHCQTLLGPSYALLREEFARLRSYSLQRRARPALKRLLITMGGVDKDNATGQVLTALRGCTLPPDCRITVVMGPTAPWLENVREIAATLPWPVDVRVNVGDMGQLMTDSDLAIGAAGSTSWERCCLGLPSISISLALNQVGILEALDRAGAVLSVRLEVNARFKEKMVEFMSRLVADSSLLEKISDHARQICDGQGAERVVGVLQE